MPHLEILYPKPAKTPIALLRHLSAKGLVVRGQKEKALKALDFIGYYRLLIYMRPFQHGPDKQFYPGVRFDEVLSLYDFDRKLRILFLDAIERIEVAMRSAIVNTLVPRKNVGPHFYLDSIHFNNPEGHRSFLGVALNANPKKSLPIKHYYENYNTPALPPIWAILESTTFGNISFLFSDLHLDHRKAIASKLSYDETIISSWLKSLNTLRNTCAHHGRLWNVNQFVNAPKPANRIAGEFPPHHDRGRVSAKAVIIAALLKEIDPHSDWKEKFKNLLTTFPVSALSKAGITTQVIGFPPGWELRPFWN